MERAELVGFIWKHGEMDYSSFAVELAAEDKNAIEAILQKYETDGFSVRNCADEKIKDVMY